MKYILDSDKQPLTLLRDLDSVLVSVKGFTLFLTEREREREPREHETNLTLLCKF